LVEPSRVAERFHVMSVFLWLLLAHLLFGLFSVWTVFIDSRFELTDLLGRRFKLELDNAVNVYKIICFLRGGVEKIHLRNFVRLKSLLKLLIRKVKPELGRAVLNAAMR
jgi:hypothetical protein